MPPSKERSAWLITLAAAAILMVTMGARQSLGLFISPLKSSTGLGITTISLAFAIAQLMWGVIQPVSGAVADRYGPAKILIALPDWLPRDGARYTHSYRRAETSPEKSSAGCCAEFC